MTSLAYPLALYGQALPRATSRPLTSSRQLEKPPGRPESLPEGAEIPDVPLSVYFGAEDSLPRRLELDLTGALAQYMDEALGLPGLIAIDCLTVSVTLGDYGSAVPATPPAEL